MPGFSRFLGAFVALVLAACSAAPDPEPADDGAIAGQAPALGKADGTDTADRECHAVLRQVTRLPAANGDGYEQKCKAGKCNWVFTGHVDVAREAYPQNADVRVIYRLSSDSTWWEVPALAVSGGRPGFFSHQFEISEHLVGPKTSATDLANARIELIPFVRLSDGTRVFDHNRRKGDFDVYSFGEKEWFVIGDEPVCQPVAGTLSFQDNWQVQVGGALHADGWLSVEYSLARLPECRGTHNGYPAWDTVAFIKFLPGGQLEQASVRDFVTNNGVPTSTAISRQVQIEIPSDATGVELWFHNFSGAGNSCDTWDSNYGANYRFDILPPVSDARCLDVERWSQIYGGKPTCVGYVIEEEHEASNCELYLEGFGHGYEGHYGIPFEWLEAYVMAGGQDGELLNVGMLTRYEADGETRSRFSLGTSAGGDKYKTGFTFFATGVQGSPGVSYSVKQVAFFIDVRRPSGKVVRLWQSRGGANYGWDDAFGAGTTQTPIPYGNKKWANAGAVIFDGKNACQP